MRSSELPHVSVLLPVYNGERYLGAAIESVLEQSYPDFELLIINDGSTDGSAKIAQSYRDERIRYFEHENRGLAATLNICAQYSRGHLLFRQDQDDISLPDRFERQVQYLAANPDVALLGTWSKIFSDTASQENRFHRHPVDQAAICHNLLFDTPFVHSSVAMRKTAFESVGGYSIDPERQPPEDFELWSRICRRYKAANLPEVLLAYREVPGSMSRVLRDDFSSRMTRISEENLSYWLEGTRYSDLAKSISTLYHLNSSGVSKSASFNDIEAAILHISKTIAVRFNGDKENSRLAVNAICRNLQRKYYLDRYSSVIGRVGVKAIFRLIGAIRA